MGWVRQLVDPGYRDKVTVHIQLFFVFTCKIDHSIEQGPVVGLTVLLVVSLLTVKSDRRELVDKVRRGVISEGPKDEGGLLHWSRGVVVGLLGSWVPTDAILLIRAPDCYPVVVDWWKIR